eukprot:TRINITY_DN7203_c0_g1_i1.p2 TRINITY_DN7203_c0_g1~~TRINITY_DN7203_c0_g1_i1.p2  ORF type:complete len:112 (+),score=22.02 TRINITY_DN7203_c0_g1_i1:152-487(+)
MIRRPPRSTHCISSAASDVYKRQLLYSAHALLHIAASHLQRWQSIGITLQRHEFSGLVHSCLLYTSDAADDMQCVDLGGRRIIKKKKKKSRTRNPSNHGNKEIQQTRKQAL